MAALALVDDPQAWQALGGVYNNRALILLEQEQYEPALAYSEKALALQPFLDDNRGIREKLGLR